MKAEEAKQYPLLKDYNLSPIYDSDGGLVAILVPSERGRFVIRSYGFIALRLLPLVKDTLGRRESVTVSELEREIDSSEILVVNPFRSRINSNLRNLIRDGILNSDIKYCRPRPENKIRLGKNYKTSRVIGLRPNSAAYGGVGGAGLNM